MTQWDTSRSGRPIGLGLGTLRLFLLAHLGSAESIRSGQALWA